MRLPPIIERELRTASRRGLTYWTRLGAAAAAMGVAMPLFIVMTFGATFGASTSQMGQPLFTLFAAVAFFACMGAGWFFAVDAIANERREGTLELLFLAPLRPTDVVLSKLVAVTWRGAQWVLSAAPLFALPILLGGVRGSDFVTLACLIGNTLLWSMATCLCASSRATTIFEALVGALILQAVFFAVPFLVDLGIAGMDFSRFEARVSLLSPLHGWFTGFSGGRTGFWVGFGFVHLETWILLAFTVWATARQVRQDPSNRPPGVCARLNHLWKYGSPPARVRLRTRLLDSQPVRWLVERERGPIRFLIAVPLLCIVAVAAVYGYVRESAVLLIAGSGALFLLSVLVAILLAVQACRHFVEARRTGALELLLVTTVRSREIVHGQLHSLARTFAVPVVVLLAGQIALAVAQSQMMMMGGAAPGVTVAPNPFANLMRYQWLAAAAGLATSATGYVALAWVGLWMGLACRQVSVALFATIAIAKIFPWFALAFAQSSFMPLVLSNRIPAWLPSLAAGLLGVGINLGLIFMARLQLLPDLRRILNAPFNILWPTRRTPSPSPLPPLLRP